MEAEVAPVPAPVTIHAGTGCGSARSCSKISSAIVGSPYSARAGPASVKWSRKWPPSRSASARASCCTAAGGCSAGCHRPPSRSMRTRVSAGVFAGTTARNERSSRRAKWAPATATAPPVAATTVVSAVIRPLAIARQNMARTRRCFTLPAGCADSSLR